MHRPDSKAMALNILGERTWSQHSLKCSGSFYNYYLRIGGDDEVPI